MSEAWTVDTNFGGWVGVDLDGTLAKYDGWKGPEHIGEPLRPMQVMVMNMLANGVTVKIFTARADDPLAVQPIEAWCLKHLGRKLQVTNKKDFACACIFDDRAVQVIHNDGGMYGTGSRSVLTCRTQK